MDRFCSKRRTRLELAGGMGRAVQLAGIGVDGRGGNERGRSVRGMAVGQLLLEGSVQQPLGSKWVEVECVAEGAVVREL